jgi:transcriptional regulator with XRE-family HTH domain
MQFTIFILQMGQYFAKEHAANIAAEGRNMEKLLGEKLTRLRNDACLKQTELARRIKCNESTLSRIENGSRLPGPALLSRILQVYKIHFHWNESDYYAIYNDFSKMLNDLTSQIPQEKAKPLLQNESHGLVGVKSVHKDLDRIYLRSRWQEAKNSICILNTWLWTVDPLWATLERASMQGVNIQILLLDPRSDITKNRLLDLKYPIDSVSPLAGLERIKNSLERGKLSADKTEVRLYNALPPFALYTADDFGMLGIFWHDRFSSDGPLVELDIKTSLLGMYAMETYTVLWNSASPYKI